MTARSVMPAEAADREIFVTRVINAPRELVFNAFSDRENISRWWGPHGFTTTTKELNFRPGGQWVYTMHGPDGTDYPNRTVYTEIKAPERIAYDHDGGEGSPLLFKAVATFEVEGKRTRVTLRLVFATPEQREAMVKFGAIEGGNENLARLDDYMAVQSCEAAGERAFVISRTFDAPRDLVWRAHSEAEHLKHWWGPKASKISIENLEFRPGGLFHYVMRYSTGAEMWGRFVYREIAAPARIVWFNSFSNAGGGITRAPFTELWPLEMITTVTFVERRGKTELALRATPHGASEVERLFFEGFFDSLNQGFGGTYDQLAEYLRKIS